ncbi:MAG TPA: HEAT repeat domain-containing protein [Candidatus Binataceae bacterium]|nr:HEAT repeat domain-containing protein [Candidatus Binataceae bacterium]
MAMPNDRIMQIQNDLRSDQIDKRDMAVQQLLILARQDETIRAWALPMFRAALASELHAYAANYAVDGIELIAGLDAARSYRLAMLIDPRVEMVRATLLSIHDPECVGAVVETLDKRGENEIRIAAIRQLGRLGTSVALPALLKYLDIPQLRPHVVEALGDLGDPAAISYLRPLLNDRTEAWPVDNHGPMLRVCDLAKEALERLNLPAGIPPAAAPPAAASAPASRPASGNGPIRLFDNAGRQVIITRDEWRRKVLPANLKKEWDNPDQLFGLIVAAINDGFRAEIVDAANHLYEIDSDRVRSAGVWAAILIEESRLDEAEHVVRDFLARHGENGPILTQLAKVYVGRSDKAKAEETLARSLQLDPNQEAAIALYESLLRERQGTELREVLEKIAAVSGSWRAQLELADEALVAGQLDRALAYYKESIAHAPRPVSTDLLIRISGALGNHGHPGELIALTEPLFAIHVHGIEVANNLIKAHLDLGQTDDARRLVSALYVHRRPDWKSTLDYWNAKIVKPGSGPPDRKKNAINSRWTRLAPYAPLIALGLQIPWSAAMLFVFMFTEDVSGRGGQFSPSPVREHILKTAVFIPTAIGLLLGIYVALFRFPLRRGQRAWLILGCLACAWALLSHIYA